MMQLICINPNKAGLFEGTFSSGGSQLDPLPPLPLTFQEELI